MLFRKRLNLTASEWEEILESLQRYSNSKKEEIEKLQDQSEINEILERMSFIDDIYKKVSDSLKH